MSTVADTSSHPPADAAPQRKDRLWLVIVAAALWGTDGLLRVPLVSELEPSTIVFAEHAIICVVVLPWLAGALRAFAAAPRKVQLAILAIGIGASAVATTLFTAAFALGDPVTPLVLQKLQPVIAIVLAALLLGERVTVRFPLFVVPTLLGAWLLTFPDPLGIALSQAQAGLLAVGAATLWAGGTVLGRYAASAMATTHVTMLRLFFGLIASFVIVLILGAPLLPAVADIPGLVLLALIPGLLALLLYYRGLAGTAAARATLGELAFPLTAAFIGVTLLDGSLDGSQWIGFALLLASVTLLALHERRARTPAITVGPLQPATTK
ncbi:MAG: DMT family transporter [Actinomycetota bacterium]|nr:DMT family transporter [Actinomycetota bacterium]